MLFQQHWHKLIYSWVLFKQDIYKPAFTHSSVPINGPFLELFNTPCP